MNEAEMAAVNAGVQPESAAAEETVGEAAENQTVTDAAETVASAAAVDSVFDKLPAEGSSDGQSRVAEASKSVGGKNISPVGNVAQIGDSGVNGVNQKAGTVEVPGAGNSGSGTNQAAGVAEASAVDGSGNDTKQATTDAEAPAVDGSGNEAKQAGVGTDPHGAAESSVTGTTGDSNGSVNHEDSAVPKHTVSEAAGNSNGNGKQAESAVPSPIAVPPARDYEAEWKELAEAHPEVVGTTLPEDIFQACIKSDQPPLRVYESMMLQKMRDEVERLKQENDRLKQNHNNAQRAPVTGTLAGGATDTKEEDPFIAGFNRYR